MYELKEAIQLGLKLCCTFEGNDGFGNISGNFDDQGLSCGALSFTWRQGHQQPLVLENKIDLVKKYMPNHGEEYYKLCKLPVLKSYPKICLWSEKGKVKSEYGHELKSFWNSPEMILIQVNHALDYGKLALNYAMQWSHAQKRLKPFFLEFLYFFDLCIQNGNLAHVSFLDVQNFLKQKNAFTQILSYCSLSKNIDLKRNSTLWSPLLIQATEVQKNLFVFSYLRALKSHPEFITCVLNRKGLISLCQGFVNQTHYDLIKEFPLILIAGIK